MNECVCVCGVGQRLQTSKATGDRSCRLTLLPRVLRHGAGLIKQFLKDTHWGELDFLVIDSPPGTSDEHISLAQYRKKATTVDGAIIVTTPQVSKAAVACSAGVPPLCLERQKAGRDKELAKTKSRQRRRAPLWGDARHWPLCLEHCRK